MSLRVYIKLHVEIALAFVAHSEANNLTTKRSKEIKTIQFKVKEAPLNMAAMSDLRSGVYSQTQVVLHLPGVF